MASPKKPAAKKPRAKNTKPKSPKKEVARKKDEPAPLGDNSKVNQPLIDKVERVELLKQQIKAINKDIANEIAAAKDQHGVSKKVFRHVVAMRALDPATRTEFEHGLNEMNGQIGYQFSMNLLVGDENEFDGYEEEGDDRSAAGNSDDEDDEEEAA